jgi:hypothetical protein
MHSDDGLQRKFDQLFRNITDSNDLQHDLIDQNGTIELSPSQNLASRANQAVLMPLKEALRKDGLKQVTKPSKPSIQTSTHGKHLAIISSDFFADSLTDQQTSILASAVIIDGQLLPLIPAWLTSNGLPKDFGPQSPSFEQSTSCAAVVTFQRKNDSRCGIIASEKTHSQLRTHLKKACTNVGLWQGANGHGFVDLLHTKSGLFALIGWSINQANQKFESRSNHICIGFSSLDTSNYPMISGVAIIDPHPDKVHTSNNVGFYEVAFEAKFNSNWEISGLDNELLKMIEVADTKTFGFQSIKPSELTKIGSWVANAKPGSYLHTRAVYQANGDSEVTAQRLLAEHQKDTFGKLLSDNHIS